MLRDESIRVVPSIGHELIRHNSHACRLDINRLARRRLTLLCCDADVGVIGGVSVTVGDRRPSVDEFEQGRRCS